MAWLLAHKLEMTRVIKGSELVPVTLLKVPALKVAQVKTLDTDGYNAIVIGVVENEESSVKEGNTSMSKTDFSELVEIRMTEDAVANYKAGDNVTLDALEEVANVKVIATSKGKGFAGAMKRHNFSGGPASHGSKFHRALGSIGNRKPTRTHRGKKMHGHMGNERVTLKSVPVELVNKDLGVIGVRGPIPGGRKSLVILEF